jgi:chromosome segregation ATPase
VSLSRAAIAELNREVTTLTRQRTEIDEQIAALQKVLHRDQSRTQTEPQSVPSRAPKRATKWVNKAVVKAALKERPGVKGAALTELLRQRGYKTPGGAKRLSHRVYNELWRLVKDDEATKTSDGRFMPKEGGA